MTGKECRSFRGAVALVAALGVFSFGATDSALGQFHGITIAKGCLGPVCEGELTSCDFSFGYNDGNGDTLRLHGAWDVQDVTGDGVRLPSLGSEVIGDTFSDGSMIGNDDGVCDSGEVCEGNLPIVAAAGNTTCAAGGSLPCVIGPGGSVLNGLPGDPQSGLVTFRQDTYVVEVDDPNPVVDQANIQWEDLCDDPATSNCGVAVLNVAQAPGSTPITRCDDGDSCTTDTCSEGVCTFTPDCTDDADCGDEDVCTADSCVEGCCRNVPECSGAGTCGDGNECTADLCTQAGCCLHIPDCDVDDDCDDNDACTTDVCDEDGCCVNTPLCSSDEGCDDGDACTTDTCGADGCCTHDPIRCDDGDECTEDVCDAATGCSSTPIDPPPAGCGSGAGCTPGFWKQSQHLQYWVTYSPNDLFDTVFGVTSSRGLNLLKALSQGGGGEIALGRHAVAALLNAATKQVAFGFTEAEVIALVQEAYASGDFSGIKDLLEEQNELGCTVDKSGDRGGRSQSNKSLRG